LTLGEPGKIAQFCYCSSDRTVIAVVEDLFMGWK